MNALTLLRKASILSTIISCTLLTALSQGNRPDTIPGRGITKKELDKKNPNYQIVERGQNHQVWQKVELIEHEDGEEEEVIHSYTELSSGLNYWDEEKADWDESRAQIVPAQGGAVALQGQQKVIFSRNLNSQGSVDILSPDGVRLTASVLGLSYFDALSGESVILAELKNSIGELVSDNQIIYRDAFDGIEADVLYTYELTGLEQDVILRENPPSPAEFGLPNLTTRLEVMTEWYDAPDPVKKAKVVGRRVIDPRLRDRMVEPDLVDEDLDFGEVKIGQGKAFWQNQREEAQGSFRAPVAKKWEEVEGRTFLFESVEFEEIEAELKKLPVARVRASAPRRGTKLIPVSLDSGRGRKLPDPNFSEVSDKMVKKSHDGLPQEAGFVIDYYTLSGTFYNYTFDSKTTYYFSGNCYFYNTTTIEGGTVIKFAPGAYYCYYYGSISCKTDQYRPAFFTAKDDDTVGFTISGSTGTPSGYYGYINFYFQSGTGDVDLHDVNVRYGSYPYYFYNGSNGNKIRNSTIVDVSGAFHLYNSSDVALENVLIDDCDNFAFFTDTGSSLTGSHLTVNNTPKLLYVTTCDVTLENSIITDVTTIYNYTNRSQAHNVELSNYSDAFQSLGAGDFYLKDNSPYRDFEGAASISSTLSEDFKNRTTYPPISYPENYHFSEDTVLRKVIPRDDDKVDLGYHYPAVDYAIGSTLIDDGVKVSVTEGTTIMTFGFSGFSLWDDSSIEMKGTATNPVTCVQYRSVQEQPFSWGLNNFYGNCIHVGNAGKGVSVDLEFVKAYGTNGNYSFLAYSKQGWWLTGYSNVSVKNCELFNLYDGVKVRDDAFCIITVQNNNFVNLKVYIEISGYVHLSSYNNLYGVKYGQLGYNHDTSSIYWNVYDNFNHLNTIYQQNTTYINHGNNGYRYSAYGSSWRINTGQSSDRIFYSEPTYSSGHLGESYQNSSHSMLWNTGSRTAAAAGLYHYTTRDTYAKEGNSTVDIGFHYVATDTNGFPIDTDGDLIPDYIEDTDGDGLFDVGETDWQTSENGTTGVPGLQVYFPN